jgi:hypothetical protein
MIDYYSRWIEAVKISRQTASAVIAAMKYLFARLGVPKIVRSDNGTCYNCKEFLKFAKEYGFRSITSSPRYPESNGLAESAVRIVKRLWKKSADKDTALMSYRTTPLATGYSPSELMFGRSVRTPLGKPVDCVVDYDEFERNDLEQRQLAKSRFDNKYNASELPKLEPGDKVWVKAPTDPGAEGIVRRKHSTPDSYWVSLGDSDSEVRRNRKHLRLLQPESLPLGKLVKEEQVSLGPAKHEAGTSGSSSDAERSPSDPPAAGGAADLRPADQALDVAPGPSVQAGDRLGSPKPDPALQEAGTGGRDVETLEPDPAPQEAGIRGRDYVVTRSGRTSRRPHQPGYEYY